MLTNFGNEGSKKVRKRRKKHNGKVEQHLTNQEEVEVSEVPSEIFK
jgi:hypothetical protein